MTITQHPAQHRSDAGGSSSGAAAPQGRAPEGMWAVAWRLHRAQNLTLLAVFVLAGAAMVTYRTLLLAAFARYGCDPAEFDDCATPDGGGVYWGGMRFGFHDWAQLAHLGMLAGPVILGAFAGAAIFARELSLGTQVFALTQSVSRARWFAVKATVAALPLTAVLLALGFLLSWMDGALAITSGSGLNQMQFFGRAIMPAATGLLTFGITIAASVIGRNLTAALVVGVLVGFAGLVGAGSIQPYVLTGDRTVTPLEQMYPQLTQDEFEQNGGIFYGGMSIPDGSDRDLDQIHVRQGYLLADGKVFSSPGDGSPFYSSGCFDRAYSAAAAAVGLDYSPAAGIQIDGPDDEAKLESLQYQNAFNAQALECMRDLGVTSWFSDTLPGRMLWPLRLTMAGLMLGIGALGIGAAAWRLRAAVAKR